MQSLEAGQSAENKRLWSLSHKQDNYYHIPSKTWGHQRKEKKKVVELEDGRASVKQCLLGVTWHGHLNIEHTVAMPTCTHLTQKKKSHDSRRGLVGKKKEVYRSRKGLRNGKGCMCSQCIGYIYKTLKSTFKNKRKQAGYTTQQKRTGWTHFNFQPPCGNLQLSFIPGQWDPAPSSGLLRHQAHMR